jgi:hypothetical protein
MAVLHAWGTGGTFQAVGEIKVQIMIEEVISALLGPLNLPSSYDNQHPVFIDYING